MDVPSGSSASEIDKMRIVFLDRSTIGPSVNVSKPAFDHCWAEYDRTAPDKVIKRLAGADIAVPNKVPIQRDAIEALPNLKMIWGTALRDRIRTGGPASLSDRRATHHRPVAWP